MQLPALEEILRYENPAVVTYFAQRYPSYTQSSCQQLFKDLLAWLWLNARRQKNQRPTYFFGPLLPMDEMWHVFILHSRDYLAFCEHYFKTYFHHDVEPLGYEHQLTPEELGDLLNDCFEYLGEDWVNRYFADAFSQA